MSATVRGAAPLVLAAVLAAGCAGHASTMHDVRAALAHGEVEEARARLADAGRGTDDLLFALEDGLLLHYAGYPELSNARLAFAEARVDELYTKSISRAMLSLVSSDLILRFEPTGIDPFLIHHYRALNYLELGDPEAAEVEWRRLAFELQYAGDQGDAPYLDPPFFEYVAGLGLEAADPDAAYVAFRRAEAGYRRVGSRPPPELVADLMGLAQRLGHPDHLDEYRRRYAGAASGGRIPGGINGPGEPGVEAGSGPADVGEIVVLVEDGFVAPLEEVRAYIPILVEQVDGLRADEGARLEIARGLADGYAAGRYDRVKRRHARRARIAYVLPVAFPTFGRGRAAFDALTVRADASAVSGYGPGRPLLPVSDLQGEAFRDRLPGIHVKTIARALTKYVVTRKLADEAEKKEGEGAGEAVETIGNVVNIVTERADTRAWLGLPHRIWLARITVPPGDYTLTAELDGGEELELEIVSLNAGERRFVTARIF